MVPKGWDVKKLEDLASVERGKFSVRPRNDPKYYGGEIPFVQTGDIAGAKTYLKSYSQTLNEEGLKVSRLFPKNTILMTIAANIGDVAITSFDVACPDSLVAIQPKESADVVWLYFYLETCQKELDGQATKNAQKNINLQVLRPLKVLTPPLPEQQKIAKILSTWDKAISTTERLIDNSTQQKKALMQQLLTSKKRLLDDEGKRFAGDWNKKILTDICSKTISYGIVQTGEHVKDGVPCVRVVDLTQKTVSKNDMITTSDEVNKSYNKTILESGEVMMALRGVVGLVRLVNEDLVGSNITRGLARLAPKTELIKSDFFLWILRSSYVKNELMRKVGGSALQEISLTALRKVQIPFPSLQEQQKIATVLTNADKEIELLEQQLADLQQEKKALMQQLLTGKVRVVVDGEVGVG